MTVMSYSVDDLAYCTQMVREQANDLYLASLLMPAAIRDDLTILNAFHVEAVNITLSTREPMAGEIRLQWWVEVLNGTRTGEAAGHPLARALLGMMGKHNLPAAPFEEKLNAHIFDLYSDPMEDLKMFEGWCGQTRSMLLQTAAWIAAGKQEVGYSQASGHAGIVLGVVGVLQHLPRTRRSGQLFFPLDLLSAAGLESESFLEQWDHRHEMAVNAMIDVGLEHHSKALLEISEISTGPTITYLHLSLGKLYLDQMRRSSSRLHERPIYISQLRKQWTLLRKSSKFSRS